MTDAQPMQVDVSLVRELAQLLDETNLTEIEVEEAGRRIRVARTPPPVATPIYGMPPATPAMIASAPTSIAAPTPAPDDLAGAVRSPIVGTAYLTSEPGQPPFVSEGQVVAEGDTLMIIEAMKVMNPILAPRAGRVARVLIANAVPVEYDQPLMIIA
jgi:acetyl-CoA carboxylase biotin carboxyl carrier protein